MSFNINWHKVPASHDEALCFLTRLFYIRLVHNLNGYDAILGGDEMLRLANLAREYAIEALELRPPDLW